MRLSPNSLALLSLQPTVRVIRIHTITIRIRIYAFPSFFRSVNNEDRRVNNFLSMNREKAFSRLCFRVCILRAFTYERISSFLLLSTRTKASCNSVGNNSPSKFLFPRLFSCVDLYTLCTHLRPFLILLFDSLYSQKSFKSLEPSVFSGKRRIFKKIMKVYNNILIYWKYYNTVTANVN